MILKTKADIGLSHAKKHHGPKEAFLFLQNALLITLEMGASIKMRDCYQSTSFSK